MTDFYNHGICLIHSRLSSRLLKLYVPIFVLLLILFPSPFKFDSSNIVASTANKIAPVSYITNHFFFALGTVNRFLLPE